MHLPHASSGQVLGHRKVTGHRGWESNSLRHGTAGTDLGVHLLVMSLGLSGTQAFRHPGPAGNLGRAENGMGGQLAGCVWGGGKESSVWSHGLC